jgi:hypothetical protein
MRKSFQTITLAIILLLSIGARGMAQAQPQPKAPESALPQKSGASDPLPLRGSPPL